MKINKYASEVAELKRKRKIANFGCDVCPCCGEDKKSIYYIQKGILDKGINDLLYKIVSKGIFSTKLYRIDCYYCLTCGAEWESEPYED